MSQNEEKKEMPSLAEQGRNLVNLMKDVGDDIFTGQNIFVDQFEQQRRYDTVSYTHLTLPTILRV